MIEGLETVLEGTPNTGLQELRELLVEVLGKPEARGRLVAQRGLSHDRVYRLCFQREDGVRSLVVKRLPVDRSLRERLAITSWLPREGFGKHTAPLLGIAAQRRAEHVWHVYEDLGDWTLAQDASDPHKVQAAVDAVAAVHVRFAAHPLLAEARSVGGDFGPGFFASSMEDAVRGLRTMRRLDGVRGDRLDLVERLLERLTRHRSEAPERARLLTDLGWPETLQHGDLWTTNILVVPAASGLDVRLIDWDHSGVGPAVYDLSTLLRRFPREDRRAVLTAYGASVSRAGWAWPDDATFNFMGETAELARYATCVAWSTVAAAKADPAATPDWVFEDLFELETWFQDLAPLLPSAGGTNAELRAA